MTSPREQLLFDGHVLLRGAILVLDADLVHAASHNGSGARRRALLISQFAKPLYAAHLETLQLRSVRMDTSERFEPAGHDQAIHTAA